jgi:hypothetical protein
MKRIVTIHNRKTTYSHNESRNIPNVTGGTTIVYQIVDDGINIGYAKCHDHDNYNKKAGRDLALERLLDIEASTKIGFIFVKNETIASAVSDIVIGMSKFGGIFHESLMLKALTDLGSSPKSISPKHLKHYVINAVDNEIYTQQEIRTANYKR